MDAGFSSLAAIKAHLLPAALDDGGDYDTAIQALGKGVAAAMNRFCNRVFQRASDMDIFTADRLNWVLRRYPVESITKLELQDDYATGWVDQPIASSVAQIDTAAGILTFYAPLGAETSLGRVSYTGGFWFDTAEDGSGSLPEGATALPDELKLAWLLQCEHTWSLRDKLGIAVTERPAAVTRLDSLELIPEVERVLRAYIRRQMG